MPRIVKARNCRDADGYSHRAVPGVDDLRPLRRAKNITLTAAANQLGVWPTTISELESSIRRNDDLAQTYRDWLAAA